MYTQKSRLNSTILGVNIERESPIYPIRKTNDPHEIRLTDPMADYFAKS